MLHLTIVQMTSTRDIQYYIEFRQKEEWLTVKGRWLIENHFSRNTAEKTEKWSLSLLWNRIEQWSHEDIVLLHNIKGRMPLDDFSFVG